MRKSVCWEGVCTPVELKLQAMLKIEEQPASVTIHAPFVIELLAGLQLSLLQLQYECWVFISNYQSERIANHP